MLKKRFLAATHDFSCISLIAIEFLALSALLPEQYLFYEIDVPMHNAYYIIPFFALVCWLLTTIWVGFFIAYKDLIFNGYQQQGLILLTTGSKPPSTVIRLLRATIILGIAFIIYHTQIALIGGLLSIVENKIDWSLRFYVLGCMSFIVTYLVLVLIELATGKYLPNWLTGIQIVNY